MLGWSVQLTAKGYVEIAIAKLRRLESATGFDEAGRLVS
jgi:hypothetical protein